MDAAGDEELALRENVFGEENQSEDCAGKLLSLQSDNCNIPLAIAAFFGLPLHRQLPIKAVGFPCYGIV